MSHQVNGRDNAPWSLGLASASGMRFLELILGILASSGSFHYGYYFGDRPEGRVIRMPCIGIPSSTRVCCSWLAYLQCERVPVRKVLRHNSALPFRFFGGDFVFPKLIVAHPFVPSYPSYAAVFCGGVFFLVYVFCCSHARARCPFLVSVFGSLHVGQSMSV